MKKIFAILVASFILVSAFSGCAKNDDSASSSSSSKVSSTESSSSAVQSSSSETSSVASSSSQTSSKEESSSKPASSKPASSKPTSSKPQSSSSKPAPPPSSSNISSEAPKPKNTCDKLVDAIMNSMEAPGMLSTLDKDSLTSEWLYNVNLDYVDEYSGQFSQIIIRALDVVVIKAKQNHINDVADALYARKAAVCKSFEQYLQDQYEIAKNAKIIVKDQYCILLLCEDVEKAEKAVNNFFK